MERPEVVRAENMDDRIMSLQEGLDTIVRERG